MRAIPRLIRVSALLLLAGSLLPIFAGAQVDMQQRVLGEAGRTPGRSGNSMVPGSSKQGVSMVPEQLAHLKLAPGYLIELNVLDDSDFAGQFRVDEQGNIAVPEVGPVHIAGETTSEARRQIAKLLLNRGLMKDPQVELNLLEYTAPQVTILGEVASPGVFPLLEPENLESVLALAGGPTMLAGDRIEITPRKSTVGPIEVHYSRQMNAKDLEHVVVHPGDTIQVKRAGIVYVLGSVNRPGGYIMQEDGTLSVLQAISIAGGTAVTASTGSVYVMRKNPDNSMVWLKLPFSKMTHGKASDVQLHVNDILYMPNSKFKTTFNNTQSVLSSAASAAIYAGVLY